MWFRRNPSLESLRGIKRVKIKGVKFTIRRVNPLMDFPSDKLPQLFTEITTRRSQDLKTFSPQQMEIFRDQMLAYVQAGVVEPALVASGRGDARGKEDGITAEDLFRDPDMGMRLYFEIVHNSLNVFTGFKGVFFSIKKRLFVFIFLRLNTAANLWTSSILKAEEPPTSVNPLTSSSCA